MKTYLIASIFFVAAFSAFAQQTQSPQEIVASCNIQVGQALAALGQSQQQIIVLQSQVADLQKQIADLKSDPDKRPKSSHADTN